LTFQSFVHLHESLALSVSERKGGILTVENPLCVLEIRKRSLTERDSNIPLAPHVNALMNNNSDSFGNIL
jgi:hypothetical protein